MTHANPFPLTVVLAVLVPWLVAAPIAVAIWRRRRAGDIDLARRGRPPATKPRIPRR